MGGETDETRRPITLKWLAASHDAALRDRIAASLASRGLEPAILEYATIDGLVASMGADRADILAASSEMAGDPAFEAAIRKIAKQYPLDVLCYGKSFDPVARSRLLANSTVSISASDDPADTLAAMAADTPRWRNPRFVRGLLISRALDLEGAMDDCIIRRLSMGRPAPGGETLEACYEALYNQSLSMSQKWAFLKLVMTVDGCIDGELLGLIQSVAEARNRVAHVRLAVDDSGTVVSGHTFHENKKKYTFDASLLWETVREADEAILRLGGMVACMDAHGQ